jgi:hypothetical protein
MRYHLCTDSAGGTSFRYDARDEEVSGHMDRKAPNFKPQ